MRTVTASPEVEYAGFVEVNPRTAEAQAEKYGVDRSTIFTAIEDALAAGPVDGVINVTPPPFHRDVSCTALEAGVPVLSEKPLADSMAAARDIMRTAQRTGVLHVVAQNYRYRPPIQALHRLLASGEMGAVTAATVEFFRGPHFGGFREEMAYPLIVDMSIHHFDLMRFLLGSDPVTVFGRSWNPPWSWFKGDASATVTLDFASGAHVAYNGSWCSQGRDTSWNADWRFDCARGEVRLRDDQVSYQRKGEEPVAVPPEPMERESQAYLLHEFYAAAMNNGPRPATVAEDNVRSLGIVFDVVKAFETGAPVRASW
jgi:predicted dehydrogenase